MAPQDFAWTIENLTTSPRRTAGLPRIDDTLDTLSGHKWFSTLDLKSGYWQVEVHPEDREKQHSLPAKDYGSSKSCRSGSTMRQLLSSA
ncbi:hypothetical protein TNCV_1227491 [Trichonephila clavipes]|nr:hypothetical protein TNCV_1227491 [Trichonephila clavipes]